MISATSSYQKTFKDDFNIALSEEFVSDCFEQSLGPNEHGLTTITSKNKLLTRIFEELVQKPLQEVIDSTNPAAVDTLISNLEFQVKHLGRDHLFKIVTAVNIGEPLATQNKLTDNGCVKYQITNGSQLLVAIEDKKFKHTVKELDQLKDKLVINLLQNR